MSSRGARVFTAAKAHAALTIAGLASLAILAAPTSSSTAGPFELKAGKVRPAAAYFAGKTVKIGFRAADGRERRIRVVLVEKRTNEVIRRWRVPVGEDLAPYRFSWSGKRSGGGIARNGRYVARAGPAGRPTRRLGSFQWRRHAYPVAGPHADRGYLGEYGAPRSGGRRHEGFDVNSPCGTRIVAARGGKVLKSRFDRRLMGNFVVIKGRRSGMRYLYAHLRRPSPMRKGDRVRTAQLVGRVGRTGNAASTPCHLHFELRRNGPVDPEPFLRRWDRRRPR